MSDQQDIFNIRKQMSSADHEVVTVSHNIVTTHSGKRWEFPCLVSDICFSYQVFIAVHMCVHFHICLFTSTSIFALFKQCFTLKDFSPSPHSLVYTVSANLYLSFSNLFSIWCSSPFSSKGRIVNVIHAWILGLHIRTRTREKIFRQSDCLGKIW